MKKIIFKILCILFYTLSVLSIIATIVFGIIAESMPKTVFNKYNIYTIILAFISIVFYVLGALFKED